MIRVLHLGSPTALYGAERWILALARYLDPQAVESVVAAVRDDPSLHAPLCAGAAQLGLRTHVFDAFGRVNWRAVTALRRFLVDERVDVLHTHGYKTDLIGLFATRGTACRLVTTPHGWSVDAGFKLVVYEWLDRAVFPFFDAVVPLSQKLYDELARFAPTRRRLHLIQNGVDIGEIDAVAELAPEARRWREEGRFVIGYVGQLIPRKGLATLLRAFAALPPGKRVLAIVGEGEQRAELEQLAGALGVAGSVEFLGFRADRLALLKGFDAFVLPSQLEGIPRCLMEAMAARVPIVASDIPGCRELVAHERTGLLVPCDDAAALAAALARMDEAAARERFAAAARDEVERSYSAAAMARRYEALYRSLVGGADAGAVAAGAASP